jgi:hypothetical protein
MCVTAALPELEWLNMVGLAELASQVTSGRPITAKDLREHTEGLSRQQVHSIKKRCSALNSFVMNQIPEELCARVVHVCFCGCLTFSPDILPRSLRGPVSHKSKGYTPSTSKPILNKVDPTAGAVESKPAVPASSPPNNEDDSFGFDDIDDDPVDSLVTFCLMCALLLNIGRVG